MDDMTNLDRLLASEAQREAGPSQAVNDAAIFAAITATHSRRGRFRYPFSATRFVVAGATVVLFGGILLAGVLPQPSDEAAPAAASPTATTLLDLLPGVDLVTEAVEPGVYKISNDGVRDLAALDDPGVPYGDAYMLVVGQDDGVWIVGPDRDFFRLGDEASHRWTDEPVLVGDEDVEIAADGTTWSANEWRPDDHGKGMHLMAYDGASWTNEGWVGADGVGFDAWQVELGPDGTVWAVGMNGLHVRESTGWTRWPTQTGGSFTDLFHVSDDGTRWFSGSPVWRDSSDWRGGDPAWEAIRPETPRLPRTGAGNDQTAISPSGTVWMHLDGGTDDDPVLTRFDSGDWTSWTAADGVPPHIHTDSWWGHAMAASNDGSVWLAPGERDDDGGVCVGDGASSGGGVSRFDGARWTHHLDGLCVHALAVTRDGTAWVRASRDGAKTDPVELYAIDPAAVAAAAIEQAELSPPATPTENDATATRSDILSGMDLVTAEVEPGVLKVVNDGVRDLATEALRADVVVGDDGGIWQFGPSGEFFRLGVHGEHHWPDEPRMIGDEDIAIDPGGTVWSANPSRPNGPRYQPDFHLMAYRDGGWSPEETYGGARTWLVESGPAGVWALGGRSLYRVEEDGWTREPLPGGGALGAERASQLLIADDGTRWLTSRRLPMRIWRDRSGPDEDASWERVPVELGEDLAIDPDSEAQIESALGPSGNLWVYVNGGETGDVRLGHLFEDGWSWWAEADGVPARIGTRSWWGDSLRAPADGSIWLVAYQDDAGGGRCDQQVSRFDGTAWSHYLSDYCVHGIDVARDGKAWVRARASDAGQALEVYVITPEAADAAEE